MRTTERHRTFDNCLNCGFTVEKKFCSGCGQENIELKEPFWFIFWEGLSSFFELDSRLLNSFVPFFFKPGFLTREYLEGRRVSYINPVRLYFFVSVVLMLMSGKIFTDYDVNTKIYSFAQASLNPVINESNSTIKKLKLAPSSDLKLSKQLEEEISVNGEYKKLINALSNDGSLDNAELNKLDESGIKPIVILFKKNGEVYSLLENFFKEKLKVILILLIPLFAFYLRILFFKRKIFYQDHLIVILYLQSFLVLFISLILSLLYFFNVNRFISYCLISLTSIVYIFFTLKKVYSQNYFKTFYKTIILMGISALTLILALLGSFFQIVLENKDYIGGVLSGLFTRFIHL